MNQRSQHRRQKGFALVVSLLILVVLTLLGVSMFSNVGLQQKMAGNIREKNRSFHAAQTALQFGEWWLTQSGHATQGVNCSGPSTTLTVCCNAPSTTSTPLPCGSTASSTNVYTQVPWNNFGFTYSAPVSGQLTVSTSGGLNTYASSPHIYIQWLSQDHYLGGDLYRVTAWASGGNANAITVVQSIYLVNAGGGSSTPAVSLSGS